MCLDFSFVKQNEPGDKSFMATWKGNWVGLNKNCEADVNIFYPDGQKSWGWK